MFPCLRRQLEEFPLILGIVHPTRILLKSVSLLHLFDVPLAQNVDGVGRSVRRETEKPTPPLRPVFSEGHAILPKQTSSLRVAATFCSNSNYSDRKSTRLNSSHRT